MRRVVWCPHNETRSRVEAPLPWAGSTELPAARCRGVPSSSSPLLSQLQRHYYGRAVGCSGSAPLGNGQLGSLMPWKPPPPSTTLADTRWCRRHLSSLLRGLLRWLRPGGADTTAGDNPGFSLHFRLIVEVEEPETSENPTQSFEIHYIFWRCTRILAVIIYSI